MGDRTSMDCCQPFNTACRFFLSFFLSTQHAEAYCCAHEYRFTTTTRSTLGGNNVSTQPLRNTGFCDTHAGRHWKYTCRIQLQQRNTGDIAANTAVLQPLFCAAAQLRVQCTSRWPTYRLRHPSRAVQGLYCKASVTECLSLRYAVKRAEND